MEIYMEFKKIDDTKFQCVLYEEDLEDNNICLDDFFRNDTEKIHGLLDVVMEEAQKNIGIRMDGGVMSLQLAPQPNHSILLTISSGKENFGRMLKQAGEQAMQAIESLGSAPMNKDEFEELAENILGKKNADDKDDTDKNGNNKKDIRNNFIKANIAIFSFNNVEDVEEFCGQCPRTWGIINSVYKDVADGKMYLILEKGRSSEDKYKIFTNMLMEYAEFDSSKPERAAYIKEHFQVYIKANAINIIKKYCS